MNCIQDFFVKPAAHEIVNTTISLAADKRPAILGTVRGPDDKPVDAALITLYRADALSVPVAALYTDQQGQFAFGPLEAGQLYHVKVFQQKPVFRTLEQEPAP